MKRSYKNETSSHYVTAPKPTTLNLQTRAFAPTESDAPLTQGKAKDSLAQTNIPFQSSEDLLAKLTATPTSNSTTPSVHRKLQGRASLIQAKLNIGEPNDKYEKEADEIATKVVQQINAPSQDSSVQRQDAMEENENELQMKPAISKIQRQGSMEEEDELQMKSLVQRRENIGGGEASTDLESSIQRARGSGQSLDARLKAKMGQAMGADFSGVKVHTDSQSDQLNKSIQAKAFTTGQDVFFRQGAYDPSSRGGQELIAHELTHVVQQTGAGQTQSDRPIINKAPAQIQRLISKDDFIYLAGQPSSKAKWDSSTYTKILQCLQNYEKTNDNTEKRTICAQLKQLCLDWIDGHTEQGNNGDIEVQENSDIRKADYIGRLLGEVQVELGERTSAVGTPSEVIGNLRQDQTSALSDINQQEGANPNAANYKLTLFAAIQNPYLIKFAQKRLNLTIQNEKDKQKNKFLSKKKEKIILTNTEIKNEAAKQVLEEEETQKFQGMTLPEQQAAIQKLADASSAVGHTWVELSAFDANDQAIKEHSFGFYPLGGYNRPELSVPGQVVYPDTIHQNDPSQLALDYDLTQDQYDQALAMAISQLKSPPEYKLIDYNCTLFAKKIVQTAGQKFPGNAFMTIPSGGFSAVTGFNQQKAFNPNGLYEALESNPDAYEPEEVQQAQQKAQQQTQQQVQQAQEQAKRQALEDILSDNLNVTFKLNKDLWGTSRRTGRRSAPKGQQIRINDVFTVEDEDTYEDKVMASIDVGQMYQGLIVDAQELHDAIADQL